MTILLVVAKAPVPGQVKTRLCPPVTPEQAAEVAAAALIDTVRTVRAIPDCVPVLAMTEGFAASVRADEITRALAGWLLIPQRGRGLGERLANAHRDAATLLPERPVVQIGMDTPQVTRLLLDRCIALLGAADAVLGPATDGGWWLLGLRDPAQAEVLTEVPMSTAWTARHTRDALIARGLCLAGLPELSDVDDWDTARTVARTVPGSRFAAAVARVDATLTNHAPPMTRPADAPVRGGPR